MRTLQDFYLSRLRCISHGMRKVPVWYRYEKLRSASRQKPVFRDMSIEGMLQTCRSQHTVLAGGIIHFFVLEAVYAGTALMGADVWKGSKYWKGDKMAVYTRAQAHERLTVLVGWK